MRCVRSWPDISECVPGSGARPSPCAAIRHARAGSVTGSGRLGPSDAAGRGHHRDVGAEGPIPWRRGDRDALIGHVLIFGIALSLAGGPTAAMFSEMFGSRIRYTGASVGYQLAGVFGAALSPIIAASLFEVVQSGYAIAIYVAINAVISIIAVALMPESRGTDIIADVEHAALA